MLQTLHIHLLSLFYCLDMKIMSLCPHQHAIFPSDLLCFCDTLCIVLIAESMAELQDKFYGWKSALESKGLKVNLRKINVMVSELVSIRPSSKKDPCGICGRKPMLNAVLCKSCGNLIHGRPITCAKIKRVTNRFQTFKIYCKSISYHFNLSTCNRSSVYPIFTRFT